MVKYGLLIYNNSYNIGDTIQSLAVEQYLPKIDYYIDRDTQQIFNLGFELVPTDKIVEPIICVFNGWYHNSYCNFNLPNIIKPIFISIHINDVVYKNDKLYNCLDVINQDEHLLTTNLKKYNKPIGTRDYYTLQLLNNDLAYYSSCITLTLQLSKYIINEKLDVLIVDTHILYPELLNKIKHLFKDRHITYLSQATSKIPNFLTKDKMAREQLNLLASSKLIITSRLHTFFPCLAFESNVIFIHPDINTDTRFSYSGEGDTIFNHLEYDKAFNTDTLNNLKDLPNKLTLNFKKLNSIKNNLISIIKNNLKE